MGEASAIEWTDNTFNPWRGCQKVSPGCANCYAEALAKRFPDTFGKWGANGTRVVAAPVQWNEAEKWNRRAQANGTREKVFSASVADIFEDWQGPMVDNHGNPGWFQFDRQKWKFQLNPPYPGQRPLTMEDVREEVFALISRTENLDYILVTKRPENVRRMWQGEFLCNVWLMTSVENQETANERIPTLLDLYDCAPVLGLSMEPLLGRVDLSPWIDRLDWVIVGGESGPGARPCDVDAILNIVEQCREAGVATFVKQIGAKPFVRSTNDPNYVYKIGIGDKKGTNPSDWPVEIRYQEFPR